MNIYVITACYKCIDLIDNYINSFVKSFKSFNGSDLNFNFVFVNDDEEVPVSKLRSKVKKIKVSGDISFHVLDNPKNIGVTRSRNKAADFIYRWYLRSMDELELKNSFMMYFDADDVWSPDSVRLLSSLDFSNIDTIFLPVETKGREINKEVTGLMTNGKFCSFIPAQECIYCWRSDKIVKSIEFKGYVWYQDKSDCKYFPEDIMLLENPKDTVLVLPSHSICYRDYDEGSITKNWKEVIHANISAFNHLGRLHNINMLTYHYPKELRDYVHYLNVVK
jgi:hypothetical protein